MASLAKHRGKWTVRWRDLRGRQHRRPCPDKATAERLQRDVERAHTLGRDWEPEATRQATVVGVALTAYLHDRSRVFSGHTIKRTGEGLEYARQLWGHDMPLADLTRKHLSELWAWLRLPETGRHGKQRDLDTCAKHLGTLHKFWEWASTEYETECPAPRRIELPRNPPRLPRAPTWADCDAMIAACDVEWHRRVAILARFTGARSAELLSLDWADVDLEGGKVVWHPRLTKGGWGGRVVPLPDGLRQEMAGWGKRVGHVCAAPTGAAGHMRDDFRRAWKRAGVREELWAGQPSHAFRKALETELRMRGVAPEVLNFYIGHRDTSTGSKYYADPRWAWDRVVEAVKLIDPINVEPRRLEVVR